MVDFRTSPEQYRHWRIAIDGRVATLALAVDENGGIIPGYELKLNSYDLGVDLELYDATVRLRFEHPEVACVIITSAKDGVFCAGANIKMLAMADHSFKVNFCKYTNETRLAIEDASENSHQHYITAINGACAGGGYELALATEYILMADDGSSAVSLPELPLLAVLPGTGGLTRLIDKRKVRRDHADFFCTTEEGVRGERAVKWRLADEVVPRSRMAEAILKRATGYISRSPIAPGTSGIRLSPLDRTTTPERIDYRNLSVTIERDRSAAIFMVRGPRAFPSADSDPSDDSFWPLALAREVEDAILHLRFNENTIGTWIFRSEGDNAAVEAYDHWLIENRDQWLAREILLYWKRVLKRIDVSARSLFALIEPGSCFAGILLELVLTADRTYMLSGTREGEDQPEASIRLTQINFGYLPMGNGLSRLATRFLRNASHIDHLKKLEGVDLDGDSAGSLGLVGFISDEIDWADEVRLAIESRAAFSPDALTGLEASLRFAGPETLETKIFSRLSAWQNWIFQRPNATGENGALKLYGTGRHAVFDRRRT
jgi:benzoyl-CoA-dihydrodiol lyase